MAEIVDFDSFRAARQAALRFHPVACMLCDAEVAGRLRDGEVRYSCSGDVTESHNLLEWSHSPEHVAIGKAAENRE